MTDPDLATLRQIEAADPGASTWLSANAGSGKTSVLVDRVARMLLERVDPQRILCLTYTKAAASEMQNRLFRRLGKWAMLEDAALRADLHRLGLPGSASDDQLREARRLFARAIETPGGLKIQTIHSFCAALLRRFPLESGVSPQFVEMEDRAAKLLREEIVNEMADGPDAGVIDAVARYLTAEDFSGLTSEITRHRSAFTALPSRDAALALFDLPAGLSVADVLATAFLGSEVNLMAAVMDHLAAGTKTDIIDLGKLRGVAFGAPGLADLEVCEDVFLYGAKAKAGPFSARIAAFPTQGTAKTLSHLLPDLQALMRRVEQARPDRIGLLAAEKAFAMHCFAGRFLPLYEARKAAHGWLDFDDLIYRARMLLTDPSVAQWVLFRLDGGIDHILVDEAQDTSPEQWAVIDLLAREFTVGQGARDVERTIFVVGDKKQSIYSFQGADLAVFDRMQASFSARLAAVNVPLRDLGLQHSFRSSEAILRLVDQVFAGDAGKGLGHGVRHLAFRADLPGRVDLWPVVVKAEQPAKPEWYDPVDIVTDEDCARILARRIAGEIRAMIDTGTHIPIKGGSRRMHEGDVLILVQRRSSLFHEIIRACKAAGLAISGADRLNLGGELAVKDIAALLGFLALPDDSLALATALRSPLFGWTEAELYALAQPRGAHEYLWEALRHRGGPAQTMEMLTDLRNQAEFLRPYDLIERALTRHGGRQRFLARLGPEAEDGMDELLSQALAYERSEVPSLTGFLGWLETDAVEIKRQPDAAGRRIRVMTVHGAKGLEAPVVVLPDTAVRKPQNRDEVLPFGQGQVVWKTAADQTPRQLAAVRDERAERQRQETMRLLYVALTRAECWLIVAAAGEVGEPGAGKSWYDLIEQGMAAVSGLDRAQSETGQRLSFGAWPAASAGAETAPVTVLGALADWTMRAAPAAEKPEKPLSPSGLGGAKALPGEAGEPDEAAAKRRGRQLHRLLEHLPLWPDAGWSEIARDLLATGEDTAATGETEALLAEAATVLRAPELAVLFGADTLAEVDISAPLQELGGRIILGTIDRLLIGPDRVLAVDYKSNALQPTTPAEVPVGILCQMGAYAAALAQIYPDRRIETAILWTRRAVLMPLPSDLIMAALRSASVP